MGQAGKGLQDFWIILKEMGLRAPRHLINARWTGADAGIQHDGGSQGKAHTARNLKIFPRPFAHQGQDAPDKAPEQVMRGPENGVAV